MGKYINTQYKDTVDSLVSFSTDLLNNPFMKFSDKKPTRVRYWNTNKKKSTLDPGSKLAMAQTGDESPIRYNVIEGLFIYGLPKMDLQFENGEFGLEANEISGEGYILPNTIEPIPGDYFQIEYMFEGPWVFQVTAVDRDTFPTGSTVWKIGYTLSRTGIDHIEQNVVEEFIALDVQEGTNLKTVVQKKNYIKAVELDELAARLKKYYLDLFFRDPVQTLIYKYLNESNMYDPYMVEFIIRNGLLENYSAEYTHIQHQMPVPNTFAIDYDRTFYRAFELCDKKALASSVYISQADYIDSMISVFHSMFDDYFALNYRPVIGFVSNIKDSIEVFPQDLIYAITDDKEIVETKNLYQNIFIKYFNGRDIDSVDIDNIMRIEYNDSKNIFYMLPLIIFILEFYTKKLLS